MPVTPRRDGVVASDMISDATRAGIPPCWKLISAVLEAGTIEVKNQQGKAISLSDPNSPQVLTTLLTEQEAAMIVNHLNELGIRAEIYRDDAATCIPALPEVRVLVRQADLAQAKEALNRTRQQRD